MSPSQALPDHRATDRDAFLWQQNLLRTAARARENAYAPSSRFRVGAALLCEDGQIFTGCNIENAAYSPTNCAERTAFFKAVSEGKRRFRAIAVVGGSEELNALCPPCGVCRQVVAEFCNPDFLLILGTPEAPSCYTLREILPLSFSGEALKSSPSAPGRSCTPSTADT